MTRTRTIAFEIVQFVPIITLASSFIVKGGVDLHQAGPLFVISGVGGLAVTSALLFFKVLPNPILLATNLWLLFGAVAFGVPLPGLCAILSQTNAVLLFATALLIGVVLTLVKPETGFIGMAGLDAKRTRRLSVILLGIASIALIWSIVFKDNIRLGGGLPFIALNVSRRMLMRRAVRRRRSSSAERYSKSKLMS